MLLGLRAASHRSSSIPSRICRLSAVVGSLCSTSIFFGLRSSRLRLGENHEECHDLEIVDPLKLTFFRVRASRREEAGDGAFLLLTQNGRDGGPEPLLGLAHVLTVAGGPVEAGAGLSVGQVPAAAEIFQAIENLLDLGEREQDAAVFTNMNQVVRGQWVSRLDGRTRRFAISSETEDHPRRNRRLARAGRGG